MSFDYSKLLGKIIEVYGTRAAFGDAMGWSNTTTTARLNNKAQWTQGEINRASDLLNIEDRDISTYFFTPKVQKSEQKKVI